MKKNIIKDLPELVGEDIYNLIRKSRIVRIEEKILIFSEFFKKIINIYTYNKNSSNNN